MGAVEFAPFLGALQLRADKRGWKGVQTRTFFPISFQRCDIDRESLESVFAGIAFTRCASSFRFKISSAKLKRGK
jgi:hypothetical protein